MHARIHLYYYCYVVNSIQTSSDKKCKPVCSCHHDQEYRSQECLLISSFVIAENICLHHTSTGNIEDMLQQHLHAMGSNGRNVDVFFQYLKNTNPKIYNSFEHWDYEQTITPDYPSKTCLNKANIILFSLILHKNENYYFHHL